MACIYEVFEHLLRLWMGIWLHIHIVTTTDTFPYLWELSEILPDASVLTMLYALVETVEPFKLHPMSMSYTYEMFEHFVMFWMGIWLHTHTITSTAASPDLGKLAVQTMPLRFSWGCRTFQTASHVHGIHIWEVWAPSQVFHVHMISHS